MWIFPNTFFSCFLNHLYLLNWQVDDRINRIDTSLKFQQIFRSILQHIFYAFFFVITYFSIDYSFNSQIFNNTSKYTAGLAMISE